MVTSSLLSVQLVVVAYKEVMEVLIRCWSDGDVPTSVLGRGESSRPLRCSPIFKSWPLINNCLQITSSRPLDQVPRLTTNQIAGDCQRGHGGVRGVRIMLLEEWESVYLVDFTLVRLYCGGEMKREGKEKG
ncbi:hypothetical protein Tco_1004239 [Tanacetum coccineum]|uniref:Uncharacterized protein n=1 Tax=Tanacetum coccineum TaxID=301880 RepID=A0ABQ5FBC6_9ASTR